MEATIPSAMVEDEAFWQHHIELQKRSGLTRAAYARQNGLNYCRFGYWLGRRKQGNQPMTRLVSIKLKNAAESETGIVLCTLDLKGGGSLRIQDTQALSIILDKML